jgi:hypothetical protein
MLAVASDDDRAAALQQGLGGGVEANPGPVSQVGDPFGPEHREGAKHAWEAPGWHDRVPVDDDLAQGTWAPWTATIGTTTCGSARTWAARSASKDTERREEARGYRPCQSRPDESSCRRPRYCLESITNTPPGPITR